MKSAKTMKRALGTSIIAMILSIAMFAGTTLAWFTDTETSGVNKIVAGNLDIEVKYLTGDEVWKDIDGATSIFRSDLWEPGHTEIAQLEIKNEGSLDLVYKLKLDPVKESGSVNVYNETFMLSDYLKWGTYEEATKPLASANATKAARDAARAKVESTAIGGLKTFADNATGTDIRLDAGETEYIALVVYMPESVDNHANHKTDTPAPFIEFGLTVVATQVESESDSFGSDYDESAKTDSTYNSVYVGGSSYTYFQPTGGTQPVDNVATEYTFKSGVDIEGEKVTDEATQTHTTVVTVPKDAVAPGATDVSVKVEKTTVPNDTTFTTDAIQNGIKDVNSFNVEVEGIKTEGNTAAVTVEIFVGKGLENLKLYHTYDDDNDPQTADKTEAFDPYTEGNSTVVEDGEYKYDASTGILTFASTHFSPFTIVFDAAEAVIERTSATYGTLTEAVVNAQDGDTITLLRNATNSGVKIEKDLTIDFNGYTYTIDYSVGDTGSHGYLGMQLIKGNDITLKNGKVTATTDSETVTMLLQNYSNLTLDNMVVVGDSKIDYVLSNNHGNVTIKDTHITAAEDKVAFDVYNSSQSAYNSLEVVVTGSSVIDGKVEISGGENATKYTEFNFTVENGTLLDNVVMDANGSHCVIKDKTGKVTIESPVLTEALIKSGVGTIKLTDGEYKMPSDSNRNFVANVTITGTEETVINNTLGSYWDNATLTFEGVTIKGSTGMANGNGSDYAALYSYNVTYNNCTFDGPFRIGRDGAIFNECKFTNLGNDYVWTYGNDVTFTKCMFVSEGKALLVYTDGGNEISQVTVKDCTFNATVGNKAGAIKNQNCAAIEIDNYGCGVNLILSGNTYDAGTEGAERFSGEWRIKTYDPNKASVTVNGNKYESIAIDGKLMTIDANKNVTVHEN